MPCARLGRQFEQENQRLIGEMNSLFDEVRCRPGRLSCAALREPGFSSVVSGPRLPAALTASSQRLATPSDLLHLPWLEPPRPVQGLKGGASLASRVSRPEESEIDSIHQLVVGATENIKEGNEDIREAIKNNAGFRVWVLFFLVMCSFSLLFLDWYDG
ncbi:Syntaxin-18 [Myotis davidii]|uniref:Syntaxin-18 n=1 Tax=Myotis davidii TaxID=225400 RepID=L5LRL7_MYODS|nr:Syntaxin-18 [Myotis davidii]